MSTSAPDRIHLPQRVELLVQRNGIRFHNIAPGRVRIEIEVENRGWERSEPGELRLESAPFGAFVRWSPLTTIPVPAIPPGSAVRVRTIARQPRPKPIGSFSGLVPPGLLTASGAGESRRRATLQALVNWLAFPNVLRPLPGSLAGELPPDLLHLLGCRCPHWAGNLNVWIGSRAVERHMAPRLRILPGRANVAMFGLGRGRDQYAFRIECSSASWRCALYDMEEREAVACAEDASQAPSWHAVPRTLPMLFAVHPPESCERGSAVVHVTQRSSGKTAAVEFDLDPAAEGPGCYTV